MSKKLATITERRIMLVAQAAQQRELLAENIIPLQSSLVFLDKSFSAVRYVKSHPVLIIGITTLIGLLKPARAIKWLSESWMTSLVMRGIRAWLTKVK